MMRSQRAIAAVRALSGAFFMATSLYGLIVASTFAYHQLIRPRLITWLVWGVTFYDALFLGVFSLTLLSLLPDVSRPRTRGLALAYVAVFGAGALGLFVYPVLDALESNVWSLVFAGTALLPLVWLAALDHVACWGTVFHERPAPTSSEPRIFAAASAAAGYAWAVYALIAVVRADDVSAGPWTWFLGASDSLLLHATAFAAIAWLLVAVVRVGRSTSRSRSVEYGLALTLMATWLFCVMRQVLLTLALREFAALLVAIAFAMSFAATWSGIALRLAVADPEGHSGLELFFRPIRPPRIVGPILWLSVLPVLAYGTLTLTAQMDWGFLLQNIEVLTVWLMTWAAMFAVARSVTRPSSIVALLGSLLLLAAYGGVRVAERHASGGPTWAGQLPLLVDRYAAYDASFKTLDDTLAERPRTSPEFYRYLIANTNIDDATIQITPPTIDFAGDRTPVGGRRPNIFLFVLDSLRPDYLSPYNPTVTFTPQIAALAARSLVFQNAFSRYGGTGLAVPSIWTGSLVPHRQKVTPFAPMNALSTLLRRFDYRFMIAHDTMTGHLLSDQPDVIGLESGRTAAFGDLCGTLTQLEKALESSREDPTPVFAYALPQNLHMSYVQSRPPPAESYPGFHAPVAAQLRRVDACLGSFIQHLESRGMLDDSLIVLTSDHGDSLGEEGRWGHNYAGFPEIFRIPLIVHLPSYMAGRWAADLAAVSFATDITPTLYALLGHETTARGTMFGASLVHAPATEALDRRGDSFLLASSYGAVYGMLTQNGRRLYVVDTVNSRDYAYDLARTFPGTRLTVTAAERAVNRQLIAEQIAEIGTFFGFDAQP